MVILTIFHIRFSHIIFHMYSLKQIKNLELKKSKQKRKEKESSSSNWSVFLNGQVLPARQKKTKAVIISL